MQTEYGDIVLGYCKLPNGNYFEKIKEDESLDDECDIKNTLSARSGAFFLSDSKRILNKFIHEAVDFTIINCITLLPTHCILKLLGFFEKSNELEITYVKVKMVTNLLV